MPEKILCCGTPAEYYDNVQTEEGKPGVGYYCQTCGNKSSHENPDVALEMFKETAKEAPKPEPKKETKAPKKENKKPMNNVPATRQTNALATLMNDEKHLMEIASPIIASDAGALKRLIKNNIRYVENAELGKVWESEEGQLSVVKETEEAMIMGIELGKMGDLVPFGKVCQLIPSVEAYDFVLTNGDNAPFESVEIECIHENDKFSIGRKSGNFFIDFESFGSPRGEVTQVAVYGLYRKTGKVIGDVFDTELLMEKARAHSVSYQRYLQEKTEIEFMRSEGKLQTKNGREFYMKTVEYFKDGQKKSFQKEQFVEDLSNPYDGPDREKMLRKSAGKSFLGPYMKVRNSEAAMNEARTHESVRDQALNMSVDRDTLNGESEEV